MRAVVNFWVSVWQEFHKSNGFTRVGSLSFTLLLSFVPCFIAVISIISLFPVSTKFTHYVEKFIFANFLPKTGEVFYHQFSVCFLRVHHLSWIAILFLLVAVFATLHTVERHINQMWEIKRSRNIGYSAIIYTCLLIFGPMFLCASMFARLCYVKLHLPYSYLDATILNVINYILAILFFTIIYKVLPAVRVKFNSALVAGIMAGTVFELAKRGFIFYATNFPTYDIIYGSLAFIPLFLIWIYISTLILLFCAQIVHALKLRQR